jgi:hypothetical protein
VAAYFFASSDLGKMRIGLMDPSGYAQTDLARRRSFAGVVLNLAILLLLGLMALGLASSIGFGIHDQ